MRLNVNHIADLVGMIGIILFYPFQNIQLFLNRDATGLSLPAFVSLLFGCAGFLVLGLRTRAYGLLVANAVACTFTVAIIIGILLW